MLPQTLLLPQIQTKHPATPEIRTERQKSAIMSITEKKRNPPKHILQTTKKSYSYNKMPAVLAGYFLQKSTKKSCTILLRIRHIYFFYLFSSFLHKVGFVFLLSQAFLLLQMLIKTSRSSRKGCYGRKK